MGNVANTIVPHSESSIDLAEDTWAVSLETISASRQVIKHARHELEWVADAWA
jgi:hypothetical protein